MQMVCMRFSFFHFICNPAETSFISPGITLFITTQSMWLPRKVLLQTLPAQSSVLVSVHLIASAQQAGLEYLPRKYFHTPEGSLGIFLL